MPAGSGSNIFCLRRCKVGSDTVLPAVSILRVIAFGSLCDTRQTFFSLWLCRPQGIITANRHHLHSNPNDRAGTRHTTKMNKGSSRARTDDSQSEMAMLTSREKVCKNELSLLQERLDHSSANAQQLLIEKAALYNEVASIAQRMSALRPQQNIPQRSLEGM